MSKLQAPFRVDHVGSFLRPKELVEAKEKFAKGEITREELTAVEDKAIEKLVEQQKKAWIKRIHRRRIPSPILALRFLLGIERSGPHSSKNRISIPR